MPIRESSGGAFSQYTNIKSDTQVKWPSKISVGGGPTGTKVGELAPSLFEALSEMASDLGSPLSPGGAEDAPGVYAAYDDLEMAGVKEAQTGPSLDRYGELESVEDDWQAKYVDENEEVGATQHAGAVIGFFDDTQQEVSRVALSILQGVSVTPRLRLQDVPTGLDFSPLKSLPILGGDKSQRKAILEEQSRGCRKFVTDNHRQLLELIEEKGGGASIRLPRKALGLPFTVILHATSGGGLEAYFHPLVPSGDPGKDGEQEGLGSGAFKKARGAMSVTSGKQLVRATASNDRKDRAEWSETEKGEVNRSIAQEHGFYSSSVAQGNPRVAKVRGGLKADDKGFLYFYMERYDGSVESLIGSMEAGRYTPLDQGLDLLDQVAEGLVGLHKEKHYHQDIKPDNLLIRGNKVFIADPGQMVCGKKALPQALLAYLETGSPGPDAIEFSKAILRHIGDKRIRDPNMRNGASFGSYLDSLKARKDDLGLNTNEDILAFAYSQADVYSMGATLAMLFGFSLESKTPRTTLQEVREGGLAAESIPPPVQNLIAKLVDLDATARPRIHEVRPLIAEAKSALMTWKDRSE